VPEQIGGWSFDPEPQTLVDGISGQRIRFEGAADEAGDVPRALASGSARLRFSYQDQDVVYPVLVAARRET
jgi:hypothetical protein